MKVWWLYGTLIAIYVLALVIGVWMYVRQRRKRRQELAALMASAERKWRIQVARAAVSDGYRRATAQTAVSSAD